MFFQVVIFTSVLFIHCYGIIEDKNFWISLAKDEIESALSVKLNERKAKNVILFIGDGMDVNTVTASRIYKGSERNLLAFEQFPHVAMIKTYSASNLVPDSASTATALMSGVKINSRTVGVQQSVNLNDCDASLIKDNQLENIITWAQRANKKTGIVTTTRVTHATPAAAFAHSANRTWECEALMPPNAKACKDIARQLVEDYPGKNLNVVLGGGRQVLVSNSSERPNDPIDTWPCYRKDGRNLINEWKAEKENRNVSYKFVENTGELEMIDTKTDYLLGVFSNSHLNMDFKRDKTRTGMPSLQQMTAAALKVLQDETNGFVLMVEGGLIDFAHHRGHARMALDETVAFETAINWAVTWLDLNHLLDDTLLIVTADHAHSLIYNGYPERGQSILGVNANSYSDKTPYTTLAYGIGGPNNYQFFVENDKVKRQDPSKNDTTDFEYFQQTGILNNEVKHGGGDVVLYAKGPMAHLFHSVHEQNYVAYVIAYAAQIGPFSSSSATIFVPLYYILVYPIIISVFN